MQTGIVTNHICEPIHSFSYTQFFTPLLTVYILYLSTALFLFTVYSSYWYAWFMSIGKQLLTSVVPPSSEPSFKTLANSYESTWPNLLEESHLWYKYSSEIQALHVQTLSFVPYYSLQQRPKGLSQNITDNTFCILSLLGFCLLSH
jgi:hypothetical protein